MFALVSLMSLISQVSGTPYIPGGDTPAGTDCSGLASWVANVASGRPAFGSRFNTGNIEPALLARGFHYGSAPDSLVIGWNSVHTAVTLPDGTPVSSGEYGRGVRIGGGGAYQREFNHHMFLPVQAQEMITQDGTTQEVGTQAVGTGGGPAADPRGEAGAEQGVQVVNAVSAEASAPDVVIVDVALPQPSGADQADLAPTVVDAVTVVGPDAAAPA